MKAAVYYGPKQLKIEEVQLGSVTDKEIIVKIEYCAICGTDLRIYNTGNDKIKEKRIIGHEITGIVQEVGSLVEGYKQGDKVLIAPVVSCGKCHYCKNGKSNLCDSAFTVGYQVDGGFAEYIRISEKIISAGSLIKLDDHADLRKATLAEPLSCVINGQEYLSIKPGDRVLVIGAGPIGVLNALLAKAKGAIVFIKDINKDRLKLIEDLGIYILDPDLNTKEALKMVNEGMDLVDVAIVACSVAEAQREALMRVVKGGRVSFFAGLPRQITENALPTNSIHYNEISVFGANSSTAPQVKRAYDLINKGIIDASQIISKEVSLENVFEGFKDIQEGKALKVVVNCSKN